MNALAHKFQYTDANATDFSIIEFQKNFVTTLANFFFKNMTIFSGWGIFGNYYQIKFVTPGILSLKSILLPSSPSPGFLLGNKIKLLSNTLISANLTKL